ncbi:carbohydrate kinase family protein [candidate division KSB1 bacterium]|nr:MAG: carbohydrate kinase family protein [candidate division KSB1 bacterium]MBC6949575.1 carbohydrate kinase family protein [candidate division KSB1 bacterium]MCE7944101.1 carbohydrate kinase family protein [Chlorobi bacterium CHB1]MDL1877051.1 carbohydrate kinase family protein [Cytophagia bacterium CHB2]
MKKLDVVVVGELNVDLILDQIQGFPELGKEKIASAMTLTLGSSSAIFASNLSSLGARVGFIGKLGEDVFGDLVLTSLQKRNVDVGQIIVQGATGTGATVAMNYDHQRAMLTYKGAMDELRLAEVRWDYVQTARHLHLSSYFLQSGIKPDCAELFRRAKDLGLSTSLDTNWDPDERWDPELYEIFPYVDIFLPNEDEAMLIATCKTVEAALDKLAQHVKTVVIKLGKSGALAKQEGKICKSDGFKVVAVDAVGAGDSFDAGFIFKWLQGGDLNQCLHFGNMCGALSVTKAGGTAAFQSREQIAQDFENYFGYKEK